MATTKTKKSSAVDWQLVISKLITRLFMIGTAAVSFTHIVTVGERMGLGWEAWTVPFLVDGIAVLGLVGRSRRFAPATRTAGLVLVTTGGALSLTCNVMAGHNLGTKLYGVLIVGGFMLTEWYSAKLALTPTRAAQDAARRSESARQGAATKRTRQAAQQAPSAPKRSRKARPPAMAPVSPATVNEIELALSEIND